MNHIDGCFRSSARMYRFRDEKRKTLVNNTSSFTLLTGVSGKHSAGRVDSFVLLHALSELQQLVKLV